MIYSLIVQSIILTVYEFFVLTPSEIGRRLDLILKKLRVAGCGLPIFNFEFRNLKFRIQNLEFKNFLLSVIVYRLSVVSYPTAKTRNAMVQVESREPKARGFGNDARFVQWSSQCAIRNSQFQIRNPPARGSVINSDNV